MTEPRESSGLSTSASISARKIGWTSAAALSHLALVSAAVETFLSQSAVRWWVLGAVALYIAAVIGVWRAAPSVWKRLTPTVLATSGVGLFLVLLAATAWLPGGQTEGIRLWGQATPVLLAAVSAVAVALSGLALWRVRIRPAWARYGFAALSLYGTVAFVIGLVTVTPYASLFQGHSFWAVLPWWLQGAFVGGVLLIPLAIAAQILRMVEQLRRKEEARGFIYRAAALATVLLVALAAVNLPGTPPSEAMATIDPVESPQFDAMVTANPAGGSQDGAVETVTVSPIAAVTDTAATQGSAEALWSQLQAALAEIPRDRFDPAAVIAEAGTDPNALFAWVRDHTVLLPYCGALKGARGVLLDRGGNALDRALLLRELLAQAGHVSRLGHAELTPEQAAPLVGALERSVPTESVAVSDTTALADRAAAELGLDAAAVRADLNRAARAEAELQAALAARTERHSAALLKALGSTAQPGIDAAAFLTSHWWVLLERPGAEPLQLDPSLPTAAPGDHFADATEQFELASLTQLAAVDGVCGGGLHTLRVRAVAEVFDGSTLVEHVLLDHELLPADLFGQALTLSVAAFGGPGIPDPFTQAAPAAALIAALLQDDEWQPVLTIGSEKVAGKAVTATGEVRYAPGEGGSGGGLLGGFGDALGGGGGSGGRFTAFWWTFEVHTPGVGTALERRQVFDLIGPAARAAGGTGETEPGDEARRTRALALAGQTELAALTAAPDVDLLNLLAGSRLLAERDAWQKLYDQGQALPIEAINERLNALGALRSPLERFALERGRFAAATGAGAQVGLTVLAHHRRLRADLSTDQAFDLIAAAPGAAAARQGGFAARLRAGVTDTNLEALLARGTEPRSEGVAVAEAFERDPGSWRIVRQPSDLHGSVLPADLAARVAADLAGNFVAVVPTDARDAVGWWRIDPATGATLGLGSRGWGQAMTEYSAQVSVVSQLRSVVNQYASMGRCLGLALSQPLQGIQGVGDELAECIFNLVCVQLNAGLANLLTSPVGWTEVILVNTISDLWGGTPEAGFGGFCGALWSRMSR